MAKRDWHAASTKHLSRDKYLGAFIKNYGAIKHRRPHSGGAFQSLAETIIYQQLSGKAADTILKRFIALFPNKKFPTPQNILKIKVEKMRGAGLSGQKALYLKDLSAKFLDGTINPAQFNRMSDQEIIDHVIKVKGIGEWSAHMFLMFTLGRPDVLPTGDLGVQKAFQKIFKLRNRPSPERMHTLARGWSGHRSLACFYLWRMLDSK